MECSYPSFFSIGYRERRKSQSQMAAGTCSNLGYFPRIYLHHIKQRSFRNSPDMNSSPKCGVSNYLALFSKRILYRFKKKCIETYVSIHNHCTKRILMQFSIGKHQDCCFAQFFIRVQMYIISFQKEKEMKVQQTVCDLIPELSLEIVLVKPK